MTRKKSPDEKYFRISVVFRGDQRERIRRLQMKRRLSAVCQAAVDREAVG